MDGILPDVQGVEVTRRIIAAHPKARVIVISINETGEDIYRAMEAGASGYLPKSSGKKEMVRAIRAVAAGERYLSEEIKERLAAHGQAIPLSQREIEVLHLVARGLTNKEIAVELRVSETTVKTHLSRSLAKLDAPDRTRAVTLGL
jgi:DNA-binding NarL/FixJ family response regulator